MPVVRQDPSSEIVITAVLYQQQNVLEEFHVTTTATWLQGLGQRFPNCGPRTTGGPQVLPLWSS
jgi:hypothetical protein